jgi:hypothetical protein
VYDEAAQIADYLPIKARDPRVEKLINHHLSHMLKCVENNLFSSSLVHLHILYMVFVYVQIQRIANSDLTAYRYSLIGFGREEKDLLKEPDYPLLLSLINEKTVFRFFRLIHVDDGTIGMVSEPVDARNKHFHASEHIACETEQQFATILHKYIRNMDKLLQYEKACIKQTYTGLPNYGRLNTRGYEITNDDLELGVTVPGYFSRKELALAIGGNRTKLSDAIREGLLA